jgi:L-asparaginase / beta-aspartyl-peptidase
MNKYAIAIHGGAGTILPSMMTPEKEKLYREGLEEALLVGDLVLKEKGSALDAVEAAVKNLENNSLFNAGKGAVFTNEGKVELDASIMDGRTFMAGAVSGVRNIKNPVTLARTIMERTEHVFLSGRGAEEFARKMLIETAPDDYFFVQQRWDQLMEVRESDKMRLDHSEKIILEEAKKFGTVGAVAVDRKGNIAAATSTGGMTNKKFGRIGDSPLIGIGTYANNETCAISCTGHGEFFIRSVVAYDVSCLIEYKGLSLKEACNAVIEKLSVLGGEGGFIAIDNKGYVELIFNTDGMYRGYKTQEEEPLVGIYKNDVI